MTGEMGARRREPLLLGTIGAVIGIVLALVVFGGFGGGNASASASPALTGASPGPSPTLATESVTPSAEVTVPPITAAPTIVATVPPTTPSTPKPTATPNTNPRIVSFDTPKQEDCTNSTAGSVHVSWSVRNATGVSISIDGPGLFDTYAGLTGEVDLPYGCDKEVLEHTYTLRTVGGTGPVASLARTIKTRAPSIVSFTVSKPDCGPADTFVGVAMSYEIRAATGAELWRDGALYSTYSVKATDDIVMYDCSQNDQVFKLVTTGGYGPAATKSITISKN